MIVIALRTCALVLVSALAGAPLHAAAALALPSPEDLGRSYRAAATLDNLSRAGAAAKAQHLRGWWSGCCTDGKGRLVMSDQFSYATDGDERVEPEELVAAVAARFKLEPRVDAPDAKTGDRRWSWTSADGTLTLRLMEWTASHRLSLQLDQRPPRRRAK